MISPASVESLHRCIKCGLCLAACPVYKQVLDETVSPRGKVQLLKALHLGNLTSSRHLEDIASRCLLCHSCAAVCPSGMEPAHLIVALRTQLLDSLGLEWKKGLAFRYLLSEKGRLGWALQMMRHLQPWLPRGMKVAGSSLGDLPSIPDHPLHDQVPERNPPPRSRARRSVIFFPGCMIEYVYPEIGSSLIRVLQALDIEVIVPRGLVCCGTPLFISGERELLLQNLRQNLRHLSSPEGATIVTACASCGHTLKKEYVHLLRELGEDDAGALEVAGRVQDISQVLQGEERLRELLGPLPLSVTYHDPCHLAKGQGIRAEPRALLRSIPELQYREMAEADACCGGGGSFQFYFPDLSQKIVSAKAENAARTKAEVVATGCPACRLRLESSSTGDHGRLKVRHTVELLASSLERGDER